jgi:pyridoxamine 5'-phosphate oxidase
METFQDLRKEYLKSELDLKVLDPNPIRQLSLWLNEAVASQAPEPNAMVLSTVTADNNPSSRVVLLKKITSKELYFFTNYESRKGREILENKNVSIVFYWPTLERQIRAVGVARKLSYQENEEYFHSRPRGAQLAASVSQQSKFLDSREDLESRLKSLEKKFTGKVIPCPTNWGGFSIECSYFEFWQGRENRLHDRVCYIHENDAWVLKLLEP